MRESTAQLQHAIDKVHLRFGEQALLRATRLPPADPWPSGLKLTLALAFLASATRDLAQTVVIDHRVGFDPWALQPHNPDLRSLAVVRPPNAEIAGEAAVALARAGAGFLLLLGELPESALSPLESAAARSGSLVVACANARDAALAHASSLILGIERAGWTYEGDQLVGLRTAVTCLKNKLAPPGAGTELDIRYPLGAEVFPDKPLALVFHEGVKPWVVRTAVG
ncbi:MAG: hypothetical protein E6I08_16625 [Chloroflexi bacterium]|nr:MAG: hypothetical protein E6I08_16625 [Chloroflexota bacterium]